MATRSRLHNPFVRKQLLSSSKCLQDKKQNHPGVTLRTLNGSSNPFQSFRVKSLASKNKEHLWTMNSKSNMPSSIEQQFHQKSIIHDHHECLLNKHKGLIYHKQPLLKQTSIWEYYGTPSYHNIGVTTSSENIPKNISQLDDKKTNNSETLNKSASSGTEPGNENSARCLDQEIGSLSSVEVHENTSSFQNIEEYFPCHTHKSLSKKNLDYYSDAKSSCTSLKPGPLANCSFGSNFTH